MSTAEGAGAGLPRTETDFACRICGNRQGNRAHLAREMMFGLRETFPYVACAGCGCIQIREIPPDLDRFYPADYYSFAPPASGAGGGGLARLRAKRDVYAVTGRGFVGALMQAVKPARTLPSLRPVELGPASRILDVGSGMGVLADDLRRAGFQHVVGIDPYLDADRSTPAGAPILKRSIEEVEPGWDLIMFHHSFEHVPEPLHTLKAAAHLLNSGGTCLIRMPDAGGEAWRRYRSDWVQLDPPRHLHVHTRESVGALASEAGLYLDRVIHDSDEFQFWGSEQYLRDIPLFSPRSHAVSPSDSIFSRGEIRAFRREAKRLNAKGLGDQAAFYLRPAAGPEIR